MSADPEQEYFADGITEDIITDMSNVSGLFVIARNSSFTFKKRHVDVKEAGRSLGVRHVLEGSVRKVGSKVRINVQLIDAASGGHIWGERYDRELEDIFVVQDEVTRRIVAALKVTLTGAEQARRGDRGKVNAEAYDYLVRGRSCLGQFHRGIAARGTRHVRARPRDRPEVGAGLAWMATLFGMEYVNGWNDAGPDHFKRALAFARQACAADESEALAHHALGAALMWHRQLDGAQRELQRAIDLDPNLAEAHGGLGNVLHFAGEDDRAIALYEQALRLDPQFDLWIHAAGRAHYAAGRDEQAEALFKRRLIRSPRSDVTRAYLASLYGHAGRHDEARRLWQELMEINPKYTIEHTLRILPYANRAPLERFVDGLRKAGLAP